MSKLAEKYTKLDKKYVEGYKRYPEKSDPEIQALMLLGRRSFSLDDNWDAEWIKWKRKGRLSSKEPKCP